MSTYTDLHNRVKENINVDYNNRITTLRVRLFNELNEFWGTLRGNVSAENINILGGSLSGVTLTDTVLKGSVALPDGIDLHKVLQLVKQISDDLIQTAEDLEQEISDRKDAVHTEKVDRISAVNAEYIDRRLEDQTLSIVLTLQDNIISTRLSDEIVKLSDELDVVRIARRDNDNYLSNAIIDARADFGREVFDRTVADDKLELSLANEVANSILRDNDLSLALSAHIDDNDKEFAELNLNMLSTIEHERHYAIYTGSSDSKTTDCWPYDCKDFAVNIYHPTVNDGAVRYTDETEMQYEVGTLHELVPGSIYPLNFKTYKNIQHDGLAYAIQLNAAYSFTSTLKTIPTGSNGYNITINDDATEQKLSNFTMSLNPTLPEYHRLLHYGIQAGKIYDAYPTGYTENVTSGKIFFDTTDPELEVFNVFRKLPFNNMSLSVAYAEGNTLKMTYLGNNEFKFLKNMSKLDYIGLDDVLHLDNDEFGRIYKKYDNISGIISDDLGISEINVCLAQKYYNTMVNLVRGSFRKTVSTDVEQGDISYNYVLSADVDGMSATFDFVKVNELYKYEFNGIDKEGHEYVGGYVVPVQYNKTLEQGFDFDTVSANIADVMWIDAFKNTYVLTKVPNQSEWTAQVAADENVLNLRFNGTLLTIKVTSSTTGEVVWSDLPVKADTPILFNASECYNHIGKTNLVDLREYKSSYEDPGSSFTLNIENASKCDSLPRYELEIDTSNTGVMKILMPERSTTDISREFMVVINPDCETDKLIKIMFVDKEGNEVKIVSKRRNMLLVPTNKWTTILVKEINHNIFYVKDLDENEESHDIDFLSAAIDSEEASRIENDKYISDELNLSVDLLQDLILSNDADIADIYEKIKGGINYKGVVYGELKDSSGNIVEIPTISNLFVWNTHHYSINNYTEDTVLSNGFMYVMKQLDGSDRSKFNIEGIDIEVRDYIIINCRSEDPTCNGKAISDLTSADVDIIDAEDSDVIHRPELDGISSFLSAEIKSNDEDIKYLSDEVSSIQWITLSGFNFLSDSIDYVSSEVSSNDNDIAYLSGNIKFLLSVDKETVNYKGTLAYLPNLSNEITHEDLGYNFLSTFIALNLGIHDELNLKYGDFFRLSAVQSCLYDANHKACWLGEKDYFIINKDCAVSDVIEEDLDLFRNSETEFGWLSSHLCAEIDDLSTSLSDTTRLSVEELQRLIISNDNDIKFLSAEAGRLSTELSIDVDSISTAISTTVRLSVEELQRLIISNDNDIDYLSGNVKFLLSADKETMNYKGTLLSVENYHTPEGHDEGYALLSTLITSTGISRTGTLKLGDFFHLSATQYIFDGDNYITLNNNDYFIANKNVDVSSLKILDLDIIRDAQAESEHISTALSIEIQNLSTSLSDITRISVDNLQNQIISNDEDIKFLSGNINYVSSEVSCNDNDIRFLSGEADRLSTELSNRIDDLSTSLSDITRLSVEELLRQVISNDNDIKYISSEVSSNDNDIEFLSNDLSTLEYQHYNKTLSNNISVYYPEDIHVSAVVDLLIILDEITFDRYRLTIRNGSLNINKIDNKVY